MDRMAARFVHAAIVGRYQTHGIRPLLEEVAQFLVRLGLEVSFDAATAQNTGVTGYEALTHAEMGEHCDLAVVVGGDGTMLGIARELARQNLPLVGINQGRLGFITDIPLGDYARLLPAMLAGAFEDDHRALMQGWVRRDGVCVFEALAMNDVVVSRGAASGMVELSVEVDGHFVANYRADGIIIATPTGSTAYSLSAGGPLLHPLLPGLALVPISPHALSNRPIVLADPGEIAIEIVAARDASASFDMQTLTSLHRGDRIIVRRSEHRARFLHPEGWSYFDTLREKLHWNKGST